MGLDAAPRRAEVLPRRRRRRGARPRARGRGDPRQRVAAPLHAELGDAAGRPQLPFFADQLLALETGTKDYEGSPERVAWDPSGVTVVITPWNAPLMLATWRVAPALAAGNAVI